MKMLRRDIFDTIEKRLNNKKDKKIIVIYGARQVGKTTLVKQLLNSATLKGEYFNCDYLDVQDIYFHMRILLT